MFHTVHLPPSSTLPELQPQIATAAMWLYYHHRISWIVLLSAALASANDGGGGESKIQLRNDSDRPFKVSWKNPNTGESVFMMKMTEGFEQELNSFIGHSFEIEETGNCKRSPEGCPTTILTVSKAPMQSFIVDEYFEIVEVESLSKVPKNEDKPLSERLPKCRERAKRLLERAPPNDKSAQDEILEELNECLKTGLAPALRSGKNEIQFQRKVREKVSRGMENFTCTDPELGSTPDVEQRHWTSEKDNVTRLVHVKLDRPASRIHVIENFASPEECDAMEETAKSRLRPASTADGKGGTHISEHRKAMQAGVTPDWHKEIEGDLVARLSRRVYDYVNFELGLNIEEHGQEPLMAIQYFGRGYNDTTPDRYNPHCDGSCEGYPHVTGSRMATMVIYCEIPLSGGHTNFQNANVHVKPEVQSAIFFSYIDPVTKLTDTQLTQHSGCPVYEGEKKIITQWVRLGVDKVKTHNAFNTLGVLREESGD